MKVGGLIMQGGAGGEGRGESRSQRPRGTWFRVGMVQGDCRQPHQGNICGSRSLVGGQHPGWGEDGEVGQEVQGCSGP